MIDAVNVFHPPMILKPCPEETLSSLSEVTGRSVPCASLTLFVDDRAVSGFRAGPCGCFHIMPGISLADGPHHLYVCDSCSTSCLIEFTIKGTSPLPLPVILYPAGIIEDRSPVIHGTGQVGYSVRLCVDGEICRTVPVQEDGTFRWPYPGTLVNGPHVVTAVTVAPDGTEGRGVSQSFQVQAGQNLEITLHGAGEGSHFRTIGLDLSVESPEYPVTLYYLLLPPGSPAPETEQIYSYTGPGIQDGSAASGVLEITRGGRQSLDLTGREKGEEGIPGVLDGYYYDVYFYARAGSEESGILNWSGARAMAFDGGRGTEETPYLIRQLTEQEIRRYYPDLTAGRSPLRVDDTARMLRNIENMQALYLTSGGQQGIYNSMSRSYRLASPVDLSGYLAANGGNGWPALGFRGNRINPMTFSGRLSGSGDTPIRGLTIIRNSLQQYDGLFAYSVNGEFRGISLEEATVRVSPGEDDEYLTSRIGLLAGEIEGGYLENISISHVKITVTARDYNDINARVGGVAGLAGAILTAKEIRGTDIRITLNNIRGEQMTGGVFGLIRSREDGVTGTDITLSGVHIQAESYIGAFAGIADGLRFLRTVEVKDSMLSGYQNVGGVIGLLWDKSGNQKLIENLLSENNTISLEEYGYRGGCLLGYMESTFQQIKNSRAVSCTLTGGDGYLGGFVGGAEIYGPSLIEHCVSENCTLLPGSGSYCIGGFIGRFVYEQHENGGMRISGCTAQNNRITADDCRVAGGFAGLLQLQDNAVIDGCNVTGGTMATNKGRFVGGFVGLAETYRNEESGEAAVISKCNAVLDRPLICRNHGGGFVGSCDVRDYNTTTLRFLMCQSRTSVQCEDGYCGGFAGAMLGASCAECFATGAVTSSGALAGGFAGLLGVLSSVTDCYASGDLNGEENYVGGICGMFDSENRAAKEEQQGRAALISRCYYQGSIQKAGADTGGLAGAADTGRESLRLERSLVLSPLISGKAPTRRVIGFGWDGGGTVLSANYAVTAQVLEDGSLRTIENNPDGPDGGSIADSDIARVMEEQGWSSLIWDYDSIGGGRGPKLLNNQETVENAR